MGLAGAGDDGGKFANWWHRHTGGGVRAKDCVPRATKAPSTSRARTTVE